MAKTYFQTIMKPSHPNISMRNLSELRLLCAVLDLLVKEQKYPAMDHVVQRIKAIESSMMDGNWERANCIELTEDTAQPLTLVGERYMATREVELRHASSPRASARKVSPVGSRVFWLVRRGYPRVGFASLRSRKFGPGGLLAVDDDVRRAAERGL